MPIFQGYISYAPFPEGFQGDMDETFQQSGQLAIIYISGNFLTGLYYPNGTTPPPLPTSDQGPIALNGLWYFWDPVTGQYLPQSASMKPARNYAKNAIYQIQQTSVGVGGVLPTGINRVYDMALCRVTQNNVLTVNSVVGPTAGADQDFCGSAIQYKVNPNIVASLVATDLFVHEHLIEGSDLAPVQGEVMSLGFSVMASVPGTYSAYLTSSSRDASYVFSFTIATANQWARIKINNIPAPSIGTWNYTEGQTGMYLGVAMGIGAQFQTSTPNQWVGGFFAGTSANINMLSVLNNTLAITAIKLEASSSCTYFTANSFETDLHDAIRYYWTSFTYQSVTGGVGIPATAHAANAVIFNFIFPRRMAKVPTVVPYGWTSFTAGKVTNVSTAIDYTVATLGATQKGIVQTVSSGITAAKSEVFAAYVTADARLN